MNKIILFDLDGTIALIEHRRHFVEGKKKNWAKFFHACPEDAPNIPIIETLRGLRTLGHAIWIVSGRSDEVRAQTENWLEAHDVPYDRLVMRRQGDFTPDDSLKENWFLNGPIPKKEVLMVFDDRDKVVAMWRRNGLVCAQVAPGDF